MYGMNKTGITSDGPNRMGRRVYMYETDYMFMAADNTHGDTWAD